MVGPLAPEPPHTLAMIAPRSLLAVLALALPTAAQIPDGWFAVSAQSPTSDGGIWLLRPRATALPPIGLGASLQVTGLPPRLIGMNDGQVRGASCVEIERDTGYLLVGEAGPAGAAIALHRLQVSMTPTGATATTLSVTPLGTSAGGNGGVTDMELLPDGDLVVSVWDLAVAPPLHGERLLRFSPATGTVTPIVTNAAAGSVESVAVDPTGTTLYFHVRPPGSPTQGFLYRCPVGGGAVSQIRQIAHFASLTVARNGNLHATSNTFWLELDPLTGALLNSHLFNRRPTAVAIEQATQLPVLVIADPNGLDGVYVADSQGGIPGHIPEHSNGLAIMDSPRRYGTGTPGAVAFAWGGTPSPQALPLPGNAAFAVQIDASDLSQRVGFLLIGLQPAATVLAGASVLVDLNGAVVLGLTTSGVPFPLPIPATLTGGLRVYCQGAFPDATLPGGVASSDGLRLGVVR